ncbi:MAG: uracil-DNA glycosylase [Treponema sp.]|nr:uracil-DNA glycosylase [Treponema sp.]
MTSNDKQTIYTLLKTAADALLGYEDPAFSGDMPVFTDDEMAHTAEKATPAQAVAAAGLAAAPGYAAPGHASPGQAAAPGHATAEYAAAEKPATYGALPEAADSDALTHIAQKISVCTRCPLSQTRTNTVPGTGVRHPVVAVIGEGPGHDEDMQGEPFVGKAGKLLDKMLSAIKLSRTTNCYICNIVKCRPPQNRTPYPEEAAACESFLHAQLSALKPRMILCVGNTAVKNLLKTTDGISHMRGAFYEWNGIPVAVTYHPSALLRDESLKRPAWEDLKMLRERLLSLEPDYARAFDEQAPLSGER